MPEHDSVCRIAYERYAVEIRPNDFTLALRDLALGAGWISGKPFIRLRIPRPTGKPPVYWGFPEPYELVEWDSSCFSAEAEGRRLGVALEGLQTCYGRVGVECAIIIERDRVRFEVERVTGLPAGAEIIVDFPYRLGFVQAPAKEPVSGGGLILPRGAGIMVDFSQREGAFPLENLIYSGGQNGYSMPLFGICDGVATLGTIVKTPYDCYLVGEINSGDPPAYAVSPGFLFEAGRLDYSRRADYRAFKGGYGELASWYRSDLQAEKRYRTLEEKAEGHPLVHTLPGSVLAEMALDFNGTGGGRTPEELADTAKRMGFPGLVSYATNIWQRPFFGTNAVPPNRGTEEDLARGAQYARSVDKAYYISVYENLIDMWPMTPRYDLAIMAKLRDGSPRPNWYAEHLKMRSSTVCSVCRLETSRRDHPHLKELIGEGSIYIDVEGAMELNECFDSLHPLTREQDAGMRRELLSHVRDLFGTVATESMPMDFLADIVDVGAYFPVYQFIGYGCSDKPLLTPPAIPIPLFIMVYHGSVLNMTPKSTDFYTCDPLYVPLWGLMPDETDEFSLRISKTMRETSYAALVEHRFLAPPRVDTEKGFHSADVQFSRFSDGTCVLANFSGEPYSWMGKEAQPGDYFLWRE